MALLQNWIVVPVAFLLYHILTIIYRLYFHPLARFPGPKIAAATSWYEAYHDLKQGGGQFMYKLRELHVIYGPIVRISPEEVHIHDSQWTDILFSGPAQGKRDKYAPAASQAGTPKGVFGTSAHDIHRKRRAALNHLFSKGCATLSENMIYDKCDLAIRQIHNQITRDGWSEVREVFMAFTTDVVTEYISGKSFGLLGNEAKTRDWHESIRALAMAIPVARQFTWVIPLSLMMPLGLIKKLSPKMARVTGMHYDMESEARVAVEEHENDEKGAKYNRAPLERLAVFRTLLLNDALPPSEKQYNRISQEAVTIIAAGADTTASALTTAVYHICKDKEIILPRLRAEVEHVLPDESTRPSVVELERLPYLTAIVKETLRLATLTARLTRVAPDEALQYGDWVMPPGTAISMTIRNVSLDPEIFPEPKKFVPERWLPINPNLDICNRYFMAFSKGTRLCLGMNLAYAELYILLAVLFRRTNYELYDTVRERDVDFVRDFFVGETSADSKGVRLRYAAS
ncbi:cytochrome P450 [Xylariaceae sp. FL0255]|nr:cytochrome P450 [Xylariaceae sp. FL0255]